MNTCFEQQQWTAASEYHYSMEIKLEEKIASLQAGKVYLVFFRGGMEQILDLLRLKFINVGPFYLRILMDCGLL